MKNNVIELNYTKQYVKRILFEKGDLVLAEPRKIKDSLLLGVLNNYNQEHHSVCLDLPLRLHVAIEEIEIPLVFPYYRGNTYFSTKNLFLGSQDTIGFWLGKNNVLNELKRRGEGFKFHYDWISKLNKSYLKEGFSIGEGNA